MLGYTLGRYTGQGIVVAAGDEHKTQRRKLTPAFYHRHVKDLYHTFWAKAAETLQAMTDACDGSDSAVVDIHLWALRCTLEIIGLTGKGVEFGAIQDENNPLVQYYSRLCRYSWQDAVLIVLGTYLPAGLVRRLPLRRNREVVDSLKQIRTACWNAIQAKKAVAEQQKTSPDICSVALESRAFSDENLVEQLLNILFAGHHTMAKAMTSAMYALCLFTDMQKQLREEVRRALPSIAEGGRIFSTDIDGMPYLNAVCKKVLRIYSSGTTTREAACDTTIQGQAIPRGTKVTLAAYGTNVDPTLWDHDAGDFKPERWLSTDAAKGASGGVTSNFAYLTFMHGPQSCLASRFALGEFACLLAAWVGRLEFTLHESLMSETNLPRKALESSIKVRISHGWLVGLKYT